MFDCRFEKLANKNKQKGDSNDENKSIREETHAYQNQLRSNKNCKCIIPVIPKNADLKEEGKMNKVKLPIKNEIVENHIKTESDAILKEIETIFNYLENRYANSKESEINNLRDAILKSKNK